MTKILQSPELPNDQGSPKFTLAPRALLSFLMRIPLFLDRSSFSKVDVTCRQSVLSTEYVATM